jgi:long-chain fatty acid transport protein
MKKFLALALILIAPAAFATNGYFTHGQGTASKGLAGATTAMAQEALDAETNPAAVAFVPKGYSLSVALFSPDRKYTVSGAPSGMPQTFGLQQGTVRSESKYFPMPAFGMNMRPTAKDAVAINLVARGGMNTDYRTNTFYGRDHTGVDLAQLFLTTTYARRITENQSLGITAIVAGQRFKASGLEAFASFSSDPECVTGNGYEMSYGFGARIGYLARVTPQLSVGAAYSPRIEMSNLDAYCGLFAESGSFDIPSSATAGLAYRIAEPLTVSFDWQRIHFGDVRSIGNPLLPNLMASSLGGTSGAGFGWNDINVAKIGLQWKPNQEWTWRAGFSTADQPVPSSEVLFNILAPGVIEKHFTAGVSKGRFNVALMYAPGKTVSGANPLEVPGQQTIELNMHEFEVEFGYTLGMTP